MALLRESNDLCNIGHKTYISAAATILRSFSIGGLSAALSPVALIATYCIFFRNLESRPPFGRNGINIKSRSPFKTRHMAKFRHYFNMPVIKKR